METIFPEKEEKIIKFWKRQKIFEKSLLQRKKAKRFIFFEGPPYANGKPGVHHLLARAFKDIILRYKTMQGFFVERKAGWDTHGLPTELAAEKSLGIKNKSDIEKVGLKKFLKECKKNIFSFKKEWEEFTERIAYWVDLKNAYITCSNDYIETLWWIIKKFWQKGLFYKSKKVVPWCPHCQTSLSSHELAQGYKKIKENSIYLKLRIKEPKKELGLNEDSYLLVWTTTPWTLPANLAVAINPDFDYVLARHNGDYVVLSAQKAEKIFKKQNAYEVVKRIKGEKLIGLKYEPLYKIPLKNGIEEKMYRVLAADFVSLDEGTGLVHIAPAFGVEDFELVISRRLIKPEEIPLTVNEDGTMKKGIIGQGKFVKDADEIIIADLKKRNLLFLEELYEHDYPFCWRCHWPLLYYLHSSWFVAVSKVKNQLIKNNSEINWVPWYLKTGRFGKWLEEAKDWNFSRERYWGAPLPVWECEKCSHIDVIGSKKDLLDKTYSSNSYVVMRHGFSQSNALRLLSSSETKYPLTEKGKKQIEKSAKLLKNQGIDLIFSSTVFRAKQTAKIVSKQLKIKPQFFKELNEIDFGFFEGKPIGKYRAFFDNPKEKLFKRPKGGENWNDVKVRIYKFLERIDKKYKNKKILLISHKAPIVLLRAACLGLNDEEILENIKDLSQRTGQFKALKFNKLPYNEKGEIDFHRPYIDKVEFLCEKCGSKMKRVKEVADVWFDSGAMPFGQIHYPFENKSLIDKRKFFPADFICEGIDQTRGWFYTLLTVSTLLGFGPPYRNVVSLGIVLDQNSQKMSKSKGNIIDPFYLANKYGADAVRWYFYTVNQSGEPKRFSEKGVESVLKKFLMTYWNSFLFFKTYATGNIKKKEFAKVGKENVLDRWIISKTESLIKSTTEKLDKFNIVSAARAINDFVVNDLSLWYIRRSRQRFQNPENQNHLEEASNVLWLVLLTLTKITAPFIPFLSEEIYQVIGDKESVHLENWPRADEKLIDKKLELEMERVRMLAQKALAKRAFAKIKVRQPLSLLKIKDKALKGRKDLLDLICEEVNVKKVVIDEDIKDEVELDTTVNSQLINQGMLRETIRFIQNLRKKDGLTPEDRILIKYEALPKLSKLLEENKKIICSQTRAADLIFEKAKKHNFAKLTVGKYELSIAIKKL